MRALVWDGALRLDCSYPAPRPGPEEALIRVRMAGICSTDREITRGYKGYRGVLGHEFVGDVVESPDPSLDGCRVCGEINVACGSCSMCTRGFPSHCQKRTVVGILDRQGVFAEYVALPLGNLHQVPDDVDDEEAVFVEPLAAAFEILKQVAVDTGDRVAVLGDGRLGILCAAVLQGTGADVTLLGKHREKLHVAEAMGVHTRLADDAGQEPYDIAVEATGSPSGLEAAITVLRPRGTLVLKTTAAEKTSVDLSPVVVNELTVVGSRCGPFPRAIAALAAGEIDVRPLITESFRLHEGIEAMRRAGERGVLKVLLDMRTPE